MSWELLPYKSAFVAPNCPGVYAIYLDRRLVYIGRSKNLRSRIAGHALKSALLVGSWRGVKCRTVHVKVRMCAKSEAEVIERQLIRRLKPLANIDGAKPIARPAPSEYVAPAFPTDAPSAVVSKVTSDAQAIAVSMQACGARLADVAAILGRSLAEVSRYRTGKRHMPDALVQAFCNATGSNLLRQFRDLQAAMECDEVKALADMLRGAA